MPSDRGSDEWLMQEVARGRREHVATLEIGGHNTSY